MVFSFPAFLTAMLCVILFAMSWKGFGDPDIWWHMRNAEYLLQHRQLPRFDMYSFTVPGHPWINHEWLGEIPYYLAWRVGGLQGLKLLSLILEGAILLGLFYLCYQSTGNLKGSALASGFSIFLMVVSYGPRTILFGYGYLLLMLIVLERYRSRGRAPLWILPPLFCLWANTHGSWLLGLIVFGIIFMCGLVEGKWRSIESERWSPRQIRSLLLTLGACAGAVFLNPYGYRLVLYPFDLAFRQKLNISHIAEWTSVDFHTARGEVVLILLGGLLLAALTSGQRWKLHEFGLAIFGLYSGLSHIRFLFLAALLVAPLLAKFLDFMPPYRPEIDKPLLNAVIVVGVLIGMIAKFPSSRQLDAWLASEYPAGALPYLRAHRISGPMLNYYLWGGYLCWNDREVKTFVDSRVDIFEYAGVLKDYIDTTEMRDSLQVLDKYQIRYVLFPPDEPLTYLLRQNPGWKVAFSDDVSVLFERVGGLPVEGETAKAVKAGSQPRS